MKANELRIGNYIYGNYETELDRGEGIIEDVEHSEEVVFIGYDPWSGFIWTEKGTREEYSGFEGIPLTEEWLLRFGFEKVDDLGDMVYYEPKNAGVRRYGLCYNHEEWQFMLIVNDSYTSLIYSEDYLQHVHQLQNLYFALTATELKIAKL